MFCRDPSGVKYSHFDFDEFADSDSPKKRVDRYTPPDIIDWAEGQIALMDDPTNQTPVVTSLAAIAGGGSIGRGPGCDGAVPLPRSFAGRNCSSVGHGGCDWAVVVLLV